MQTNYCANRVQLVDLVDVDDAVLRKNAEAVIMIEDVRARSRQIDFNNDSS